MTRAHSTAVGLTALLSVRQDFASAWRGFTERNKALELELTERHFPYLFRNRVQPRSGVLVKKCEEIGGPVQLDPMDPAASGLPQVFGLKGAAGATLASSDDPRLIVTFGVE